MKFFKLILLVLLLKLIHAKRGRPSTRHVKVPKTNARNIKGCANQDMNSHIGKIVENMGHITAFFSLIEPFGTSAGALNVLFGVAGQFLPNTEAECAEAKMKDWVTNNFVSKKEFKEELKNLETNMLFNVNQMFNEMHSIVTGTQETDLKDYEEAFQGQIKNPNQGLGQKAIANHIALLETIIQNSRVHCINLAAQVKPYLQKNTAQEKWNQINMLYMLHDAIGRGNGYITKLGAMLALLHAYNNDENLDFTIGDDLLAQLQDALQDMYSWEKLILLLEAEFNLHRQNIFKHKSLLKHYKDANDMEDLVFTEGKSSRVYKTYKGEYQDGSYIWTGLDLGTTDSDPKITKSKHGGRMLYAQDFQCTYRYAIDVDYQCAYKDQSLIPTNKIKQYYNHEGAKRSNVVILNHKCVDFADKKYYYRNCMIDRRTRRCPTCCMNQWAQKISNTHIVEKECKNSLGPVTQMMEHSRYLTDEALWKLSMETFAITDIEEPSSSLLLEDYTTPFTYSSFEAIKDNKFVWVHDLTRSMFCTSCKNFGMDRIEGHRCSECVYGDLHDDRNLANAVHNLGDLNYKKNSNPAVVNDFVAAYIENCNRNKNSDRLAICSKLNTVKNAARWYGSNCGCYDPNESLATNVKKKYCSCSSWWGSSANNRCAQCCHKTNPGLDSVITRQKAAEVCAKFINSQAANSVLSTTDLFVPVHKNAWCSDNEISNFSGISLAACKTKAMKANTARFMLYLTKKPKDSRASKCVLFESCDALKTEATEATIYEIQVVGGTDQLDETCNEALTGDGSDYRGCRTTTRSGATCQNWMEQSPRTHSRTPANYPGKGLGNHNYCRNPDGESTIWCYTTGSKRWELCDPIMTRQEVAQVMQMLANLNYYQDSNTAGQQSRRQLTEDDEMENILDLFTIHPHANNPDEKSTQNRIINHDTGEVMEKESQVQVEEVEGETIMREATFEEEEQGKEMDVGFISNELDFGFDNDNHYSHWLMAIFIILGILIVSYKAYYSQMKNNGERAHLLLEEEI
jgi:hypothetical protein